MLYLEQGLWIAAEQEAEYDAALRETEVAKAALQDCPGSGSRQTEETAGRQTAEQEGGQVLETQLHIVRRMLRYRGAADAEQTAERYGWSAALAEEILEELCRQQAAVKQDGRYYHGELYKCAGSAALIQTSSFCGACSLRTTLS